MQETLNWVSFHTWRIAIKGDRGIRELGKLVLTISTIYIILAKYRGVAQLGRALRSGRQGASKNFIFSACGSAW